MSEHWYHTPPPIEYVGIHLPKDCGCYPHEVYRQEVGFVVDNRGRREAVLLVLRTCLN